MRISASPVHHMGGYHEGLDPAGQYVVDCNRLHGLLVVSDWPGQTHERVVRCRDCEHYCDHGEVGVCVMPCGDATCGSAWADPNGFCSWAAPRGEA